MTENSSINDAVAKAIETALSSRGNVNIMIAGKTGVGKSTLINAVFQGNFAETGHGKPVTQHTREVSKAGIPLKIWDTRGLEVASYKESIRELEDKIKERSKVDDPRQHIHVGWVCISEDSRRIEGAEEELVHMLHHASIPTLVVITKSRADRDFQKEVQRLLPDAANVVRVRALSETLDDGHVLPPCGLETLVEATMNIVPEGQRNAFAASQKVNLNLRAQRAHIAVATAATSAAAAAISPIPWSDLTVIVPIEFTMLASISAIFGLKIDKAFLGTLISSSVSTTVGNLAKKAIVSGFLKLFPGAGTVAGTMLSGTTAAAFTTMFGEAYIHALLFLLSKKSSDDISANDVAQVFKETLANTLKQKGHPATEQSSDHKQKKSHEDENHVAALKAVKTPL